VLAACLLLALNDHWLKHAHPGFWSGKLSDVAFMVVAPVWLYVGGLWLVPPLREMPSWRARFRDACVLGIGLMFASMQLTEWGDAAYRHGLGALQWPFRTLLAALSGEPLHGVRPVHATPDPSDLLCLPLLLWTRAAMVGASGRATEQRVAVGVAVALLLLVPDAARADARPGGFLRLSGSVGPTMLLSESNLLSDFNQESSSTTTGFGAGLDGELGFRFASAWSLGGYLSWGFAGALQVQVADQLVQLRHATFTQVSLGALLAFEPVVDAGWHTSLRFGLAGGSVDDEAPWEDESYSAGGFHSRLLRGPLLSLSAGKEWALHHRYWLGPGLRLTVARLSDGDGTDTTLMTASVFLSAAWH
jgi:hypothetical protein